MALLLALVLILGLAGCGGNNTQTTTSSDDQKEASSEAQEEASSDDEEIVGSDCTYDFPKTGFGFDLPEGMEISKGFIYNHDSGDIDYNSGVMMGWPVYYDITEEKYDNLTPEDIGTYKTAFSFQIFCVKGVDTLDAALVLRSCRNLKNTVKKLPRKAELSSALLKMYPWGIICICRKRRIS